MFPIERYTFEFKPETNTIIAIQTWAGNPVKGYAHLHPEDNYNEEFGKALAAARCDMKISAKRKKYLKQKMLDALSKLEQAEQEYISIHEQYQRALQTYNDAEKYEKGLTYSITERGKKELEEQQQEII